MIYIWAIAKPYFFCDGVVVILYLMQINFARINSAIRNIGFSSKRNLMSFSLKSWTSWVNHIWNYLLESYNSLHVKYLAYLFTSFIAYYHKYGVFWTLHFCEYNFSLISLRFRLDLRLNKSSGMIYSNAVCGA